MTADSWQNQLYFGDNLEILRHHIPVSSVDLIYNLPIFPGPRPWPNRTVTSLSYGLWV